MATQVISWSTKEAINRVIFTIRCEAFLPSYIQAEIFKIMGLSFNLQKTVMHEKRKLYVKFQMTLNVTIPSG